MKKILTIFLFISLFRLSASTVIVNSLFDKEADPLSSEMTGYVEDGLSDSLFDRGFIMFSTYNAQNCSVEGAEDASYMITIESRDSDFSVSWRLNAISTGQLIKEGKITFDSIPGSGGMDRKKVYYLIGQEVAAKVCLFF